MAATRVTVQVEGLSDLADALAELPKATANNVVKRVLIAAAGPMASVAESMAPVPKAPLTKAQRGRQRLKTTISVSNKLTRRQRAVHKSWVGGLPAERSSQGASSNWAKATWIFMGPAPLHEATLDEFGTSRQAPMPFMRPAWDQQQNAALESIKKGMGDEIAKAVQRIARKAERLAAKIRSGT